MPDFPIGYCNFCKENNVQIIAGWSTLSNKRCAKCEFKRLQAKKVVKARETPRQRKIVDYRAVPKRKEIPKVSARRLENLSKDEVLNAGIWATRPHVCFECGGKLETTKKPPKLWFSHVHSKGARPDLRHEDMNVTLHCFACHLEWETGDRGKMPKTQNLSDQISVQFPDTKNKRA